MAAAAGLKFLPMAPEFSIIVIFETAFGRFFFASSRGGLC